MSKAGRPTHDKHICVCCNKTFETSEKKCKHEYNKRKTQSKKGSMATASIGGEKLDERMKDFQTPEKLIKDTTGSAFKQPLHANLVKPQPRNVQALFATPLRPTNPNMLNALISLAQSLQTPEVNLTSLQTQGNKQPEDPPSGFVDEDDGSIINGEKAYQQVKEKVGPYIKDISKIQGSLPSQISSTKSKITIDQSSKSTVIEDQKSILLSTQQWEDARAIIQQCLFDDLPQQIDEKYGKSFLIQAGGLQLNCEQYQHLSFVPALAKVIQTVGINKIPMNIAQLYDAFIASYQVQEPHSTIHLKQIFQLAHKIKGDLNWLKEAESPALVVVEDEDMLIGKYLDYMPVVKLYMSYPSLYSWSYIDLMRTQITSSGMLCRPNTTTFLDIISDNRVTFSPQALPKLLEAFFDLKGGSLNQIKSTADALLLELNPSMDVLLSYIEVALALKNVQVVIDYAKKGISFQTKEQLLAIINLEAKQEEEKKQVNEKEAKRKTEEAVEQIRLETEEQEKKKLQQIKEQEQKQQYEATCLQVYHEFSSLNNMLVDDQSFTRFAEQITEIATEINIVPRPEQLAVMFLMLTSTHQRTLMQRPTGTGKSLMFGLMSRYMNIIHGHKTVVAVPNEVLAAMQQKKYAPWSSKDIDDLYIDNFLSNYCTHSDVLTGNIPFGTRVFIDEIDSLFFSDAPTIIKNRFISAILLMNKYKLIGMTATF